jgi:hypothetical protein
MKNKNKKKFIDDNILQHNDAITWLSSDPADKTNTLTIATSNHTNSIAIGSGNNNNLNGIAMGVETTTTNGNVITSNGTGNYSTPNGLEYNDNYGGGTYIGSPNTWIDGLDAHTGNYNFNQYSGGVFIGCGWTTLLQMDVTTNPPTILTPKKSRLKIRAVNSKTPRMIINIGDKQLRF